MCFLWVPDVVGHVRIIWSAVCSTAPHSHFDVGARPHLCMDDRKRPTPVLQRLSLTHDRLGRPIPIGMVVVLGMKTQRSDVLVKYSVLHL